MSAQLAGFRPNDKVPVSYIRNGKEYNTTVTLKAKVTPMASITPENIEDKLGADLETLDAKKAEQYDIDGGVVVKKIREGSQLSRTRMDDGFIITSVNGRSIKNIEQLSRLLDGLIGTVRLEGLYPGSDGNYTYPLNLSND